ncbi:hypothetical protein A0H81_00337 [Grifola frondosa]|uniref:Uncharacterized protein n=1 Tax=Grifola frondosa TaxID=5627 RepID=A0A1C7MXD4_GRIFR|nr:hypothetical protein A0H81_00337 [Grifola frondosa]
MERCAAPYLAESSRSEGCRSVEENWAPRAIVHTDVYRFLGYTNIHLLHCNAPERNTFSTGLLTNHLTQWLRHVTFVRVLTYLFSAQTDVKETVLYGVN